MILILLILLAVPVYGQFSTQLSGPVTITGGALNVADLASTPANATEGSIYYLVGSGFRFYDADGERMAIFEPTSGIEKNARIAYDGNLWYAERPTYGEIYNTNVGNLTINSTYDTLNLNTTGELFNFERVGSALKYTGLVSGPVLIQYTINVEHAGSVGFFARVKHNTTSITKSASRNLATNSNDIIQVNGMCILNLQPNDLVRIECASDTNSSVFTIYEANLIITKI